MASGLQAQESGLQAYGSSCMLPVQCIDAYSSEEEEEGDEEADGKLARLAEMQFPLHRAVNALKDAKGNLELALDRLIKEADTVESCVATQLESSDGERPAPAGREEVARHYFKLQAATLGGQVEQDAQQDLSQVDEASILADLRRIPERSWRCKSRKNVAPNGIKETRQLCLGLTSPRRIRFPMPSVATWAHRSLITRLLHFRISSLEQDDDLQVTSIQITKNLQSRPHVDRGNMGPSDLIALGDFEGGETWVEEVQTLRFGAPAGTNNYEDYQVQEMVNRCYKPGQVVRGRVNDVKNKWLRFDGNTLHFTKPFVGERFCIIFFTMKRQNQVDPVVRVFLEGLGFGFGANLQDPSQPSEEDMRVVNAAIHCWPIPADAAAATSSSSSTPHAPLDGNAPRPCSSLRSASPEDLALLEGSWLLEGRCFEVVRKVRSQMLFKDTTNAELRLEGILRRTPDESAVWTTDLRRPKDPSKSRSHRLPKALGFLKLSILKPEGGVHFEETIFATRTEGRQRIEGIGVKDTSQTGRTMHRGSLNRCPDLRGGKQALDTSSSGQQSTPSSSSTARASSSSEVIPNIASSFAPESPFDQLMQLGTSGVVAAEVLHAANTASTGGTDAIALAVAGVLLRHYKPQHPTVHAVPLAARLLAEAQALPEVHRPPRGRRRQRFLQCRFCRKPSRAWSLFPRSNTSKRKAAARKGKEPGSRTGGTAFSGKGKGKRPRPEQLTAAPAARRKGGPCLRQQPAALALPDTAEPRRGMRQQSLRQEALPSTQESSQASQPEGNAPKRRPRAPRRLSNQPAAPAALPWEECPLAASFRRGGERSMAAASSELLGTGDVTMLEVDHAAPAEGQKMDLNWLVGMGFAHNRACLALQNTGGDAQLALELMISEDASATS